MPAYTRGSRSLIAQTRGKDREGIFRPNQRRRPAYFADNASREAFSGETREGQGKLIFGSTDDRGRVKSEYFTDDIGRLKIPYGEMLTVSDSPITVSGTAWTGVTIFEEGDCYGPPYVEFVDNGTADRLTIGQEGAGIYKVDCTVAHVSDTAGDIDTAIYINDAEQSDFNYRIAVAANDHQAVAISGLVALEAGDYVSLYIRHNTGAGSKDVTLETANVNIFRICHKR